MPTRVIFRIFPEGDVIALFPNNVADFNGNIMSYMHIGQHSAASSSLIKDLIPARYHEYKSLLKELIRVGYHDLLIETDKVVELHRNPTKAECRMGYGATHYKTFNLNDIINKATGELKRWTKCPYDGLRYYR